MSFLEPEVEPSPPRILLIARMVASAVVIRWRATILAFILCLTIWLGLQAILLVRGAFLYLHDNFPKMNEQYKELQSIHISPTDLLAISPPITNCWRDRSLAGDCFKPCLLYTSDAADE